MRYNRENKITLAEVIAYGSWSDVATEVYGPHHRPTRGADGQTPGMTVFCFGDGWKAFSGLVQLPDDRAVVDATKAAWSLDEACMHLLARDGIFDDAFDQMRARTAWEGRDNEGLKRHAAVLAARGAADAQRTADQEKREARATRAAVARAEREARKGTKS